MKKAFICLLFCALCASAISQKDSIDYSKVFTQESKTESISKARNILMDQILAGDKIKAKDTYNYLSLQLENDYYIGLYPVEKWLVNFWLHDYFAIISEVVNADSAMYSKLNKKVRPNDDQLYKMLLQVIDKNKDDITKNIQSNASLNADDQEFLLLTLKIYTDYQYQQNSQEQINDLSNQYLRNNSQSKYEGYVRNFYRYEYAPSGFLFGMEIYLGSSVLTGKTDQYFSSGFDLGIGFIWGYKNFILNTRGTILINNLKKDITKNGITWKNNDVSSSAFGELAFEYKFQPIKKITLSPVLGIGWFMNSPSEEERKNNEQLKNFSINSNTSTIIGFDFGWLFKDWFYYNDIYRTNMHAFSSLNIRYSFIPIKFSNELSYLNGSSHNIAISFKFGFGGAKRKL